jgi:uncharacterized short protein YbdD (DUF466 family)
VTALVNAWRWLRRVSGDDAYEQFIVHLRATHPERPVPSRQEFWREREAAKWTGVNRCC